MDEWKSGWPEKDGWYDCQRNGEECRLRHKKCSLANRHRWIDEHGEDVRLTETVLWTGEAGVSPW